jgi:hypothetical protein
MNNPNLRIFRLYEPEEKMPSRTTFRRIVERYDLVPYVCGGCGNTGTWNGQPLKLELHHIDGNRRNNDYKSNYAYMCPNCHVSVHMRRRR